MEKWQRKYGEFYSFRFGIIISFLVHTILHISYLMLHGPFCIPSFIVIAFNNFCYSDISWIFPAIQLLSCVLLVCTYLSFFVFPLWSIHCSVWIPHLLTVFMWYSAFFGAIFLTVYHTAYLCNKYIFCAQHIIA